MVHCYFPVIDPVATGHNILKLRKERHITIKDIQDYFNFEEPRAIYKWQAGQSLPSIDNLYALSALFNVSMNDILVGVSRHITSMEPQEISCGPGHFWERGAQKRGSERRASRHSEPRFSTCHNSFYTSTHSPGFSRACTPAPRTAMMRSVSSCGTIFAGSRKKATSCTMKP